jgi:hypothetical protein
MPLSPFKKQCENIIFHPSTRFHMFHASLWCLHIFPLFSLRLKRLLEFIFISNSLSRRIFCVFDNFSICIFQETKCTLMNWVTSQFEFVYDFVEVKKEAIIILRLKLLLSNKKILKDWSVFYSSEWIVFRLQRAKIRWIIYDFNSIWMKHKWMINPSNQAQAFNNVYS